MAAVAFGGQEIGGDPISERPGAAGTSGMVIYRDPATGKLGNPPPGLAPSLPEAARAAEGELREVRGTTRGGGWKLDLRGRALHAATATVGADGRVTVDCAPATPGARE
jgi:hypothetical protein